MNKLSFIISVLILAMLLGCTQQTTQVQPIIPESPSTEVAPPPQPSTEIPITATVVPTPSKIAFVRNYGGYYGWDICTANSDGTDIKRITGTASTDSCPIWSPDGTQIAFESTREWHNLQSIYTMDSDGNNVKCLTPEAKFCSSPSWSPDGKKISYCVFKNVGGVRGVRVFSPDEILIMDSNGDDKQAVVEGFSPSWLPDGLNIAFLSNRSGTWIICTINIDGSNTKEYPTCLIPSSCGVHYQAENYPTLSVSPDGKSVAFDSRDYTGRRDIYVMAFADSKISKLTDNVSGSCYSPTWSPDGSKIAFTLEQDGNTDIYVIDSDGSNPTLLIKDGMFPWSKK